MAEEAEKKIDSKSWVIEDHKKLIIVDAHDTVLKRDLSRTPENIFGNPEEHERIVWLLRDGFLNFLDYFYGIKKMRIVISSDGWKQRLADVFDRFGITRQLHAIYGREHLHPETYLKQLDIIMRDAGVTPRETVFIGDSKIDGYSAEKYGVDFIRVPSTLDSLRFSFNDFLRLDFASDYYGLEIQKIRNVKKVYHNYTSPELVEEILKREEGKLAHRGAIAVDTGEQKRLLVSSQYIVREPSSEAKIYWEGEFKPIDADKFNMLYLRLLAFLQDRELFIQDCYAGADWERQFPLRVITQTAWHSLFARNIFITPDQRKMKGFFPEFTVLHVPFFRARPDVDGTDGEAFVILNLAKKVALIGGTLYCGELRKSVFTLLGYFISQEDALHIRCSSNRAENDNMALFFGETCLEKSALSLDPDRIFIGDMHHCWSERGVFNLEQGCNPPVANMMGISLPIQEATGKFGTILENVYIGPGRRPDFNEPLSAPNARASFPIAHLNNADPGGTTSHPSNVIILVRDGTGVLPPLSRLTPEQAILHLLMGYSSHSRAGEHNQDGYPDLRFRPFFLNYPILFHPAVYALLYWVKLKKSGAACWLFNISHVGHYDSEKKFMIPGILKNLTDAVHEGRISDQDLTEAPTWGFRRLKRLDGLADNSCLDPRNAWEDTQMFRDWQARLIRQIAVHLQPLRDKLEEPIIEAAPPGALEILGAGD